MNMSSDCQSEHAANFNYVMEFTFAVKITGLIFNIVLLCKIRYGDAVINHLTNRPYYVALVLLIIMCTESLVFVLMQNVIFRGEWCTFLLDVKTKPLTRFYGFALGQLKLSVLLVFISVRTHADDFLLIFTHY